MNMNSWRAYSSRAVWLLAICILLLSSVLCLPYVNQRNSPLSLTTAIGCLLKATNIGNIYQPIIVADKTLFVACSNMVQLVNMSSGQAVPLLPATSVSALYYSANALYVVDSSAAGGVHVISGFNQSGCNIVSKLMLNSSVCILQFLPYRSVAFLIAECNWTDSSGPEYFNRTQLLAFNMSEHAGNASFVTVPVPAAKNLASVSLIESSSAALLVLQTDISIYTMTLNSSCPSTFNEFIPLVNISYSCAVTMSFDQSNLTLFITHYCIGDFIADLFSVFFENGNLTQYTVASTTLVVPCDVASTMAYDITTGCVVFSCIDSGTWILLPSNESSALISSVVALPMISEEACDVTANINYDMLASDGMLFRWCSSGLMRLPMSGTSFLKMTTNQFLCSPQTIAVNSANGQVFALCTWQALGVVLIDGIYSLLLNGTQSCQVNTWLAIDEEHNELFVSCDAFGLLGFTVDQHYNVTMRTVIPPSICIPNYILFDQRTHMLYEMCSNTSIAIYDTHTNNIRLLSVDELQQCEDSYSVMALDNKRNILYLVCGSVLQLNLSSLQVNTILTGDQCFGLTTISLNHDATLLYAVSSAHVFTIIAVN